MMHRAPMLLSVLAVGALRLAAAQRQGGRSDGPPPPPPAPCALTTQCALLLLLLLNASLCATLRLGVGDIAAHTDLFRVVSSNVTSLATQWDAVQC